MQSRSRASLERLLETTQTLLKQGVFETTNIQEIAALADSSVGSFYRLVGDRETLLSMLHERFLDDAAGLFDRVLGRQNLEGATLDEVAGHFVRVLLEIYKDYTGLLRALIIRSSQDLEFRRRVHALNDFITGRTVEALQPYYGEIPDEQPAQRVRFAITAVLGTLNQHTLTQGTWASDAARLELELLRLFVCYLRDARRT